VLLFREEIITKAVEKGHRIIIKRKKNNSFHRWPTKSTPSYETETIDGHAMA
jgi:hypothetical protein